MACLWDSSVYAADSADYLVCPAYALAAGESLFWGQHNAYKNAHMKKHFT